MSSWMNNLRSLGRTNNNTSGNNSNNRPQNQGPNRSNTSSPIAYSSSSIPIAPPSPSQSAAMAAVDPSSNGSNSLKKTPLFFRDDYSGFIVKGNFMTLAAKPLLLDEGEWLAHQIVEQTRLLGNMVKCIQSEDRSSGRSLCNDLTCPSMTAGPTTYTWIDTKGNPINLAAAIYIRNIMTWVNGKIQDPTLFPTDSFVTAPAIPNSPSSKGPSHWLGKSSGFPERFEVEIRNMYKQMFRCYAHLYWQHWIAFWEIGSHRELNTCFVHFVNVGRLYNLFTDKDTEPMQPLIDLWIRQGVLPSIEKKEVDDQKPVPVPAPASGVVLTSPA